MIDLFRTDADVIAQHIEGQFFEQQFYLCKILDCNSIFHLNFG